MNAIIFKQCALWTSHQKDGNIKRQWNEPYLDKKTNEPKLYKTHWYDAPLHSKISGRRKARNWIDT